MKEIIVTNQSEYDAVPSDFDGLIIVRGAVNIGKVPNSASVRARESASVRAWGSAHVEACGSAHVVAYESASVRACGSAHVVAWESAHVVAWESAHVVAWESAHVEAWESAHVVAYESASVVAYESASVVASPCVSVHKMPLHNGIKTGGVIIKPKWDTVEDWCAYHGLAINNDVVLLYKAVGEDYKSPHGYCYAPGSIPIANDWDGGVEECGGGLHFSPTPAMAAGFMPEAKKYLACPVAVQDMRVPKHTDQYPQKIKAEKCCAAIYEADRDGKAIGGGAL